MPRPFIDAFARGVVPVVFVFLWSSGWVIARVAAENGDVLTFLGLRFAITAVLLALYALMSRATWPQGAIHWLHAIVAGVLLHAAYTGPVWWAVAHGVPASISALLAALQPIITAALAPLLMKERVGFRVWLGVCIGLAGLCLVLWPRLDMLSPAELWAALLPLLVNAGAMLILVLGTFYQKHFIHSGDLRTVTTLQFVGATLVLIPLIPLVGRFDFTINKPVVIAMAWSVCGISIGAVALLMLLLRRGQVSRAAQLIYLVPPTAALQAFVLFGERLIALQLIGMGLTVLGVALASRKSV